MKKNDRLGVFCYYHFCLSFFCLLALLSSMKVVVVFTIFNILLKLDYPSCSLCYLSFLCKKVAVREREREREIGNVAGRFLIYILYPLTLFRCNLKWAVLKFTVSVQFSIHFNLELCVCAENLMGSFN